MNRSFRTRVLWLWCVVITAALTAADSAAQPPPDTRPPLVIVYRGENTSLGYYDQDGNFKRDSRYPVNYGRQGGSGLPNFLMAFPAKMFAYEHRSGCLIRGATAKLGEFVPEIGSTILDLKKDYDPKTSDRMIYNLLDEAALKFWGERRRKEGAFPKAPEPPAAGTPAGWEFTPFSKSHPKKPPKHARAIGDVVEFGFLSDDGEFVPDPDLPPVSRAGILGPISSDAWAVPRFYTVPRLDRDQKVRSVPTYEYRSGRLIRGDLHESGNFVPELGSKVLDFKDFDPEKEPRRWIYNLPGTLKKKGE